MIDWKEIRDQFPGLRKFTYLDTAAGCIMPLAVAQAAGKYYEESVEAGDTHWDEWLRKVEDVREKVAKFLNAKPESITFLTSVSQAMSYLALMFEGKGEVITLENEYPATSIPWIHAGYKVTFVQPEADNSYSLNSIKKYVTPETRFLVMSHVQSPTGSRLDLAEIAEYCRSNDLIFVVNATQSVGTLPTDIAEAQPDFFVFQGYKWVLGGYGISTLVINEKWLGHLPYPISGSRGVEDEGENNRSTKYKKEAAGLEVGAPHFPNIFALGAGVDFISSIGVENVWAKICELNAYLEQSLKPLELQILSPLNSECRSAITLIRTPNAEARTRAFLKENVIISCKPGGIRVSLHFYNTTGDIDRFISTLKQVTSR